MTDALLKIDNLAVEFLTPGGAVQAVKNISFEVDKGETLALVGESGSGKSVSALSILQLLPYPVARHPNGAITFEGKEMIGAPDADLRAIRGNDIAMIFQEPMTSLNPLHSIEKQINEVLFVHKGLSRRDARVAGRLIRHIVRSVHRCVRSIGNIRLEASFGSLRDARAG